MACSSLYAAKVELGIDVFFQERRFEVLEGKRVGLVSNQTGVNGELIPLLDLFLQRAPAVKVVALFSPEHGWAGQHLAAEAVDKQPRVRGIPVHSLHGKARRPTEAMLQGIDVLIYDIQDIGSRSYTYITTLFYLMEEAAKRKIPVWVFDRPNPINGVTVDGPMMEKKWSSFIGYLNIPYCHGMTVGELARYFNEEYRVGCSCTVVPMKGWKRSMSYEDTELCWIPTSPHIPEADTPFFYASTGILGELGIVNIGIGYTLPFKLVGAPWIQGNSFAAALNAQKLPGVQFVPFCYRPFYGAFKGTDCGGVMIVVTDKQSYRPVTVQYMLIGLLKTLYPSHVQKALAKVSESEKGLFCKANGNEEMFGWLLKERYVAWKLIHYQEEERALFEEKRKKYFLY